MEILEVFDLVGTLRGAAELAGCDHKTVAQYVAAREHANGKFGLRYTRGGFGTPFFGDDVPRAEGTDLIIQEADTERRASLTTLKDAARFISPAILPEDPELDDRPLAIDADSVRALGDWYGFVTSVLEELRGEAPIDLEPSRVQLWPAHFDVATELVSEAAGRRAAYGGSPGDGDHPDPYIYVAPWSPKPSGDLWDAACFTGAELPHFRAARRRRPARHRARLLPRSSARIDPRERSAGGPNGRDRAGGAERLLRGRGVRKRK